MISSATRRFLGVAVIIVYILLFLVLQGFPQNIVFEPPGLLLVLSTITFIAICVGVLFAARKSFLVGGPASLLFLGEGMFTYGMAGVFASSIFLFRGVNSFVTVYNLGLVLAASLTFVGAVLTAFAPKKQLQSRHRELVVTLSLAGIIVFNLVVGVAVLANAIPMFFIQGVGSTVLRQIVFLAVFGLFSFSSILLFAVYARAKSKTSLMYWYSLGLAIIALAVLMSLFQTSFGGWVNWIGGRIGTYLATGYLLVAIWTTSGHRGSIRLNKFLGVAIIIVYAIIFIMLQSLPQNAVFDPPGLLLVLNIVFLTATCFGVLVIARKSFIMGGPTSLLFMGGGVFAYGLAGFVGALMFSLLGVNAYVTVNNIGVLVSSVLVFLGAALTTFAPNRQIRSSRRRSTVSIMLLGIIALNLVIVSAFLLGAIPVFFVQGVGPSLLRQVVIGLVVGFFFFSSVLLIIAYVKSKSSFGVLYWFSLGFLLIGVSFVGTLFQTSFGGWVNWTARIGWYLGTGYLIAAIWASYGHEGPTRPNKFLGLAAAIAYLIVVLTVQVVPQNLTLYYPMLLLVLNTLLLAAIPMLMIYVSRNSFIMSGSYTLLFLGGGMISLGVTGVFASLMLGLFGINANSTVNNLGSLFSAALFLVSSVFAVGAPSRQVSQNHKKSALCVLLFLTMILNITLVLSVLVGIIPAFFIQGVGYTPLREAIVYAEAAVFAVSCILFATLYSKSRVHAAPYWISLGVGIFAFSMFAATLVQVSGSLLWWTVRCGSYITMACLLSATATFYHPSVIQYVSRNKSKIVGAGLGIAYLALVATLQQLPQDVILNSPVLVLVLNVIFLSAMPFVVTYISRKSFIMSGSYGLLLLGGGMFQLGVSVALSALALNLVGFNSNVTIFTIGALFSAILTFAASVFAASGHGNLKSEHKQHAVTLMMILILIINTVVALAVLVGATPTFIIPGVGPTPIRLAVLDIAVILFALSCILFAIVYLRSTAKAPTYWFALGIGLLAFSLFASGIVIVSNSLLSWTLRSGFYLGMAYMVTAIIPTSSSSATLFLSQNKKKILGGVIGLAYLTAVAGVQQLPQSVVLSSPNLVLLLNVIFLSVVPFVVTYVSRKSFIMSGSYALLLLSGGMFQLGVCIAIGAMVFNFAGFNSNVAVFTIGAFFTTILIFASSILLASGRSKVMKSGRERFVASVMLVSILIVNVGVALVALSRFMPPFLIPGIGPSPLRLVILDIAAALSAMSCILFGTAYIRSRTMLPAYWFALGTGLFAFELFAAGIIVVSDSLFSWTLRAGLWLCMAYLLAAIISTFGSSATHLIKPEQRKINERRKTAV